MTEKYTREYFMEQGRKGGLKTFKKLGRQHFSRIGKIKTPVDKLQKIENK